MLAYPTYEGIDRKGHYQSRDKVHLHCPDVEIYHRP